MGTAAVLAAAVAVAVPVATGTGAASPCTGSQLTGSFNVVPGSAGAGNIVYRLRVKNTSATTCFVSGLPSATLLDQAGHKLPTHVIFDGMPGMLTAIMVQLAHGATATTTARFSPDVPGAGEPQMAQCEKTAYKLRVTPNGGGSTVVTVGPPTPVCEHGTLQFKAYTAH
jgi:hypothetical protein